MTQTQRRGAAIAETPGTHGILSAGLASDSWLPGRVPRARRFSVSFVAAFSLLSLGVLQRLDTTRYTHITRVQREWAGLARPLGPDWAGPQRSQSQADATLSRAGRAIRSVLKKHGIREGIKYRPL